MYEEGNTTCTSKIVSTATQKMNNNKTNSVLKIVNLLTAKTFSLALVLIKTTKLWLYSTKIRSGRLDDIIPIFFGKTNQ